MEPKLHEDLLQAFLIKRNRRVHTHREGGEREEGRERDTFQRKTNLGFHPPIVGDAASLPHLCLPWHLGGATDHSLSPAGGDESFF
jgi:hypothetical protein